MSMDYLPPLGDRGQKSVSCNEGWEMSGNFMNFEQTPMARPFSIKIFCPDGNPAGLRIISKSNWTGVGLVCPRPLLPTVKGRKEFTQPGVYVLVGPPDEGSCPRYTWVRGMPSVQGWSSIMPTRSFGPGWSSSSPPMAALIRPTSSI